MAYQLTPKVKHSRNSSKNQFKPGKITFYRTASTHPYFPLSQWCKKFEQSNINLSLLRPSRINPKLSAYAQVFGALVYQNKSFPPSGMKLMAHVLPINCCLFEPHTMKVFSVGIEIEHYRCFKIFIPSNIGVHIYDTIRWFPHGSLKLFIPSRDEILRSAIDDLRTTLQYSVKNNILTPEGTTSRKTLLDLNAIFNHQYQLDPPTKPPRPADVPRVKVQSKDHNIVPRLKLHSNYTTRVTRVKPPDAIPSPQPTLQR